MTTDITTFAIADYLSEEPTYTPDYQQQRIQALNNKVEKLQKRLDDTKALVDTLWIQLKDYE